jgi:ribosomal protein L12E/L44/L45/RPP1/RPP2
MPSNLVLPTLLKGVSLVDEKGAPTPAFHVWWQQVASALLTTINVQGDQLDAIVAAQHAADVAEAAAETANMAAAIANSAAASAATAATTANTAATTADAKANTLKTRIDAAGIP